MHIFDQIEAGAFDNIPPSAPLPDDPPIMDSDEPLEAHEQPPPPPEPAPTGPMLSAALEYARRGWHVFRCGPRSKVPLKGSHGCLDATTDPTTITRWWTAMPGANVAIATGKSSNLIVMDEDIQHGGSFDAFEANKSPLPAAPTVRTGQGGRHKYFAYPPGEDNVPNSESLIFPGIDVRGDGGYVMAPPSVHPNGRRYEWLS